jgi:Rhomboid family
MTQSSHNSKLIEIQDKPTAPVFTFMLMFGMLGAYSMATLQRMDWWLSHNSFQQDHVFEMLHKMDIVGLLTVSTMATFASFHIVQMSFNIYFLWVFSKHTEQKLGPGRFILLLVTAMYLPWIFTYVDLMRQPQLSELYLLSPAMMLCCIIGCYMVFPPVPKSVLGDGNIRPKNEIFRRGQRADPLDKYIANPYTFVGVFAAVQVLMHLWCTIGFTDYFKPMKGYDVWMLVPALLSVGVGYALGRGFLASATAHFKEGPLTLAALKRYYELLELDVNHDEAIRGTARTLGLPYEKVREWVAKNKGKLRVK